MNALKFWQEHPVYTLTIMVALTIGLAAPAMAQEPPPPPPGQAGPPPGPPSAPLSPQQLQQLVAPIALYPDSLVGQILAAATYPTQIVEAERFLEQNPGLTGEALANAVNEQDWDPSVKALTAFPSVLSDMNQNLSWVSELGDANYNQPEDVMNAIQYMRQQAQRAGNLQSTPQQSVNDVNGDVEIQPANPDVVYVPEYDPEYVYGYPVGLWPGFYPWWTVGGPYISFGFGIGIGPWGGWGWGWNHWGLGWGPHPGVFFGGGFWHSQTRAFYDRRAFMHGDYRGFRGNGFQQGHFYGGDRDGAARGFAGGERGGYNARGGAGFRGDNRGAMRGFGGANPGTRSGAFGGFARGGETRGFAARGMQSMGGGGFHGGGFHGGGGGFHGGGGGHGGGHR